MNDVLVLALAIIILCDIQAVKPLNKDYLSLESCNSFRGIFALVVIFHHLAQETSGGLFQRFSRIGYLAVAVFFFYSGYGLMKKHISSPQYYKKFLCNRIPTILIPYLVINVVYWLYYTGTGKVYSIKQIMIATFQNGAPIAKFSWYIIVILLFYLCFWLLMTIFKKHYDYTLLDLTLTSKRHPTGQFSHTPAPLHGIYKKFNA